MTDWTVRSDKDTSYTTQILPSGSMDLESFSSLPGNDDVQPIAVTINRLSILSDENLPWDVMLFRNATSQPNADADLDSMVHFVSFADTDAVQIEGTGLYRYSVSDLNLKYKPDDRTFHVGLINRSLASSKTAGANGEVVIELQGTFE